MVYPTMNSVLFFLFFVFTWWLPIDLSAFSEKVVISFTAMTGCHVDQIHDSSFSSALLLVSIILM